MEPDPIHAMAEALRTFHRDYTRQIGVLSAITESRVLFEIATHREGVAAYAIEQSIGIDQGYLSRILGKLDRAGLIHRQPSRFDKRERTITLTKKGAKEFAAIDRRSHEQAVTLLATRTEAQQRELLQALSAAGAILNPQNRSRPVILRPHRTGDIGWVIEQHSVLYGREYGWQMEALVAEIGAAFLRNFDPAKERCWIAERDGERLGSVFVVKKSERIAKLRLLLLAPEARGIGLGKQLVNECIRFAEQAGYRKIVLWTQSELDAACAIYRKAGFQLIGESKHKDLGPELTGQYWEKVLGKS